MLFCDRSVFVTVCNEWLAHENSKMSYKHRHLLNNINKNNKTITKTTERWISQFMLNGKTILLFNFIENKVRSSIYIFLQWLVKTYRKIQRNCSASWS